jgi:hypothetical protein
LPYGASLSISLPPAHQYPCATPVCNTSRVQAPRFVCLLAKLDWVLPVWLNLGYLGWKGEYNRVRPKLKKWEEETQYRNRIKKERGVLGLGEDLQEIGIKTLRTSLVWFCPANSHL